MAVLKPRTRLVNFRLSEEEFQNLRAACASQGARSVSEFARGAVLHLMQAGEAPEAAERRLSHLDERVSELGAIVVRLARVLEVGTPGPAELAAGEGRPA